MEVNYTNQVMVLAQFFSTFVVVTKIPIKIVQLH